jgi:hypothetical protein
MAKVMVAKTCTVCNQLKDISQFRFHKTRLHYESECKECVRTRQQTYRRSFHGKEVRRKNARTWKQTATGKAYTLRNAIQRQRAHPDIYSANKAVLYAVKTGKLPKVTTLQCAHCNDTALEYHHVSYRREHRLNVIPLCRRCHCIIHGKSI